MADILLTLAKTLNGTGQIDDLQGFIDKLGIAEEKNGFGACDIWETTTHVSVYVDLPGVEKHEIDLVVDDDIRLGVVRKYVSTPDRVIKNERYTGNFRRTIPLPEGIDKCPVFANYSAGVLEIKFQRLVAGRDGKRVSIS